MTFFQRAATIAAMTLALGGLISTGTPGIAAELERPDAASTITTPDLNASIDALVPAALPAIEDEDAPAVGFASLDQAVAAQHDREVADAEALRCVATTVFYESKGEPLAGQLAVANVVINRAKSGRFASDPCGVVKQRGQFSFVRGGVLPSVNPSNRLYRTALAVAKVAMAEAWKSPAPNALFFNGRRVGLPGRLTKVALIGGHIFYR